MGGLGRLIRSHLFDRHFQNYVTPILDRAGPVDQNQRTRKTPDDRKMTKRPKKQKTIRLNSTVLKPNIRSNFHLINWLVSIFWSSGLIFSVIRFWSNVPVSSWLYFILYYHLWKCWDWDNLERIPSNKVTILDTTN